MGFGVAFKELLELNAGVEEKLKTQN